MSSFIPLVVINLLNKEHYMFGIESLEVSNKLRPDVAFIGPLQRNEPNVTYICLERLTQTLWLIDFTIERVVICCTLDVSAFTFVGLLVCCTLPLIEFHHSCENFMCREMELVLTIMPVCILIFISFIWFQFQLCLKWLNIVCRKLWLQILQDS